MKPLAKMTQKEEYFAKLDSNETSIIPLTEQEIEWFQEWLDTSEEGKKLSAEAEQSFHTMASKHSCELMLFFFWLRELRQRSNGDTINIQVTYVNDKEFVFRTEDRRMRGCSFGESKSINL